MSTYLNGMKSMYFMLLACVTLLMGVTSCSQDEFENYEPEQQKKYSKAELIEQALSRMPQTRAGTPFPVIMLSEKTTISVTCIATESVVIYWGDGDTTLVSKEKTSENIHTYSDDALEHVIFLEASNEAITELYVDQNELTFLEVTNNTNLSTLLCSGNNLDELDLTGCPNLKNVWAGVNNLSSIDLTNLPRLRSLSLDLNQLTDIDLSKNLVLDNLIIGDNPITDLDLTKNTSLRYINISRLPIKKINNLPINNRSFAIFQVLESLDISYTPFTSLDFSDNLFMNFLYISGTAIAQLDISNLRISVLHATNSQLTKLTYTSKNLEPAFFIKIDGTPFEELKSNVRSLIIALPDRRIEDASGNVTQGLLYTTSPTAISFLSLLTGKNWVVNP